MLLSEHYRNPSTITEFKHLRLPIYIQFRQSWYLVLCTCCLIWCTDGKKLVASAPRDQHSLVTRAVMASENSSLTSKLPTRCVILNKLVLCFVQCSCNFVRTYGLVGFRLAYSLISTNIRCDLSNPKFSIILGPAICGVYQERNSPRMAREGLPPFLCL